MHDRLISPKEFDRKSSLDRLEIVMEKLGVTLEDVELINQYPKVSFEAIENTFQIVYKRLREKGNSKQFSLEHLTASIVEPLLSTDEDYINSRDLLGSTIWYLYKGYAKELSTNIKVEVNAPTYLRANTYMNFENEFLLLNIKKTRETWGPKIKFSDADLLKGTKISRIGINQAILMGYATMGGNISEDHKKSSYGIRFHFSPKEESEFNQEIILSIIQKTFNTLKGTSGKSPDEFRINSLLVQNFFSEFLGYADTFKERTLLDADKLYNEHQGAFDLSLIEFKKGYFIGAQANRIRSKKQNGYFIATMHAHDNPDINRKFHKLSNELGYPCTITADGKRVLYGKENFMTLAKDTFLEDMHFGYDKDNKKIWQNLGTFINPVQIEKVKSYLSQLNP